MATKGGAWCTAAQSAHGRGPWAQKLRPVAGRPPAIQDGQLGLQRSVGAPTVTSSLARSAGRSPYHQSGNCSSVVTPRRGAGHSAAAAEPMCALQSLLYSEGTLWRAGAPYGGFGVDFLSGKASLERGQRCGGSVGLCCLLRPSRGDSASRAPQACRPGP